MNLVPWNPRPVPTLWLNVDTGAGIAPDTHPVSIGNGERARLRDVLDLATYTSAQRVMLTGGRLRADWLLTSAPGWEHAGHHLDHETPVGRYVAAPAPDQGRRGGQKVEIRRAAEWFGAGDYSPREARAAWEALGRALADTVPGAALLGSPGATGREAWLWSCPRDQDGRTVAPDQVPSDVAEHLRATSGQHRIELFRPPVEAVGTMRGLWLLDGRLMYAACVRELGTGPARWLTPAEACELLDSKRGRYARAQYQVAATVPDWWDGPGILPHADPGEDTWSYPATPGRTFVTHADAAEVHLALDYGWKVTPQRALLFTPGRPLDTWAGRLLRAYDQVNPDQLGTTTARMVRAGLRWMILHSVGAWHSTGRTETTVTDGPMTRPAGDGWGAPENARGRAIWRRRVPLDGRAALMAHPEWSAQIWGRARARVLSAPTAVRGELAGALYVDAGQLVSIYGDAVMTTTAPSWAGAQYDDGRPGRLRVKGHLCGPLDWPTRAADRDRLMHQAENNTNPCTCTPKENQP